MNKELLEFAQELKNNGFTVFTAEGADTWFNFTKDGYFGYVQKNIYNMGYDFSCSYVPNRDYGAGYNYAKEVKLSLRHAENVILYAMNTIARHHLKNFTSIEHYKKMHQPLKYYIM